MKNPHQGSLIDLFLTLAGHIVTIYSYLYFFIITSVVNIPLSALLAFLLSNISQLDRLWSDMLCQHEGVVSNDFMNTFALITMITHKQLCYFPDHVRFSSYFFIKSLSLKANKLRGVNNVKVLKLFKISLYHQLLSFLLYHLISSDIIKSNLVSSGNVHENTGPNDFNLKFFHWNLDNLTSLNNTKVSLIR